jgi:hypothetical protein
MRKPWTTRTPFMSISLNSAEKVLGSARDQTAAAAKRQVASIQAETSTMDDADQ